ncbi:MAG: hypothetical protein WC372_12305 [Candidatus Neomarinimicrobiota bacterium]|jgi:hypothetical protein
MPVATPTPSYPEFRERYAQDAIDNRKVPLVGSGDVEWLTAAIGPILTSADGTRWRILIDNLGRYTTEAVT